MKVDPENPAYQAGYNCGLYGANVENSHYAYFSTKESTLLWAAGKLQAERNKQDPDHPDWLDPMNEAANEGANGSLNQKQNVRWEG